MGRTINLAVECDLRIVKHPKYAVRRPHASHEYLPGRSLPPRARIPRVAPRECRLDRSMKNTPSWAVGFCSGMASIANRMI